MQPIIRKVSKAGVESQDLLSYCFEEKREIWLSGEIDDLSAQNIINQLWYLNSVGKDDIFLYINSPGGSVTAGLAIVDAINRCQCDVVTIATGIAASMGAVLLACGTRGKRYATPQAEILIHQPLGGVHGQASDIALAAERILKIKNKLYALLSEATGKPTETIINVCDRDFYLDAQEAVAFGIIDHVY